MNCFPPTPRVNTVSFKALNSDTDVTSLEVSDFESFNPSSSDNFVALFLDKISVGSLVSLLLEKSMRATLELSLKRRVLVFSNSGGRWVIRFSARSRWVRLTRGLRREGWREEIEFAFNRRELREASGLKRLAGRLSIPLWERSRWTRLAVEEKKEGGMEEKLPPWILNTFKSEKYIFERLLLDFLGSTSD